MPIKSRVTHIRLTRTHGAMEFIGVLYSTVLRDEDSPCHLYSDSRRKAFPRSQQPHVFAIGLTISTQAYCCRPREDPLNGKGASEANASWQGCASVDYARRMTRVDAALSAWGGPAAGRYGTGGNRAHRSHSTIARATRPLHYTSAVWGSFWSSLIAV